MPGECCSIVIDKFYSFNSMYRLASIGKSEVVTVNLDPWAGFDSYFYFERGYSEVTLAIEGLQ